MKTIVEFSVSAGGKICLGKRLGYLNGPNVDEACELVDANMNVFKLGAQLKFALPFCQYFVTPKMAQLIRYENKIHEYVSGLSSNLRHVQGYYWPQLFVQLQQLKKNT